MYISHILSFIGSAFIIFSSAYAQTPSKSLKIQFSEVPVPLTDPEKRKITATNSITVDGKQTQIQYNTLLRSGDKIGANTFGLIYDKFGTPIKNQDGTLRISHKNDFSSLLSIKDKIFMVSHFETIPAAMYLSEIIQDKNGNLHVKSTKNIDFSKYNGLWLPCAGSVSPWGTHLGSEEYEPDARLLSGASPSDANVYFNYMTLYFANEKHIVNPYDYGWTPEITLLNDSGDVSVKKHYSMGRFSHELAYVMPDERTVYLSDDGTNVALFMFVADKKGDLSSGTLYAAKWIQKNNIESGSASIQWINLGHSDNTTVQKAIKQKIRFKDIFDTNTIAKDGTCQDNSFSSINTSNGAECLKVKPHMDEIASRLESRRYAAIKGATTEFRKMEGISFNPDKNTLYLAMSSIDKGMEDNKKKNTPNTKYEIGGNNDIKLPLNKCGAVYSSQIVSLSQYAHDATLINSDYVIKSMQGILSGIADKSVVGNHCSINQIANPDNISYIPYSNTLIIGEDSKNGHQNDYIWAYNLKKKQLTRILTTPYGSEATSPYFYSNLNGYSYIMSVIQHPYGEKDALESTSSMKSRVKSQTDIKAYTGYIGPIPTLY